MILKERNIIMLPTKNKSNLLRNTYKFTPEHGNPFEFRSQILEDAIVRGYEFQHIYFTSTEEIKEGDLTIHEGRVCKIVSGRDWRIPKGLMIFDDINHCHIAISSCNKKIIATTNPDLWFKAFIGNVPNSSFDKPSVPKIPLSFVEAYVKEQGSITKVMLEYWDNNENTDLIATMNNSRGGELKLRPDGSVIIHSFKERIYTLKEVKQLCYNAFISHKVVDGKITPKLAMELIRPFEEWFDKNYPE